MLTPSFGKIYPLEAFDYAENHRSYTGGDLKIVGLMLRVYMAGHKHRPEAEELVEWIRNPDSLENHQLGALREFVDSWTGYDLWVVHVHTGCTIYQIANAMKISGAMSPLSIHHINSLALGYSGSDDEPDDREFMKNYGPWNQSPLAGRSGFSIIPNDTLTS